MPILEAPFPWYGGKRLCAAEVWAALGDVDTYIEPFAGSLAVLLARPHAPKEEIVCDLDHNVANAWRSMKWAAKEVADWCDWPINDTDLQARLRWIAGVGIPEWEQRIVEFRRRMVTEPEYFDAKQAGWWVWGIAQWMSGRFGDPKTAHHKSYNAARGAHGIHSMKGYGKIEDWMLAIQRRFRRVLVACDSWEKVLPPHGKDKRNGVTGVFIDPPYTYESGRMKNIYKEDHSTIAHDCRKWCIEYGNRPKMRAILCGYDVEHDELLEHGWRKVTWYPTGFQKDKTRERLWLSPQCLGGDQIKIF